MYKKGSKGWLKHFDFILLDMICLQIAFLLAYVIRHDSGSPYIVPLYRNMAIFMELLDIVVMFFYETLSNVLKRGYFREFAATVKHVLLVELFSVLYLFTMQEGQAYSRTALYLTGVIYAILTYIVRIIWKKILRSRMSEGNRSLLVVTTKDMAEQVVHNIRENNYERFALSGLVIIDDDLCGTKIAGVPVVANEENAAAYVCREWIDEVFVIPTTDVPYPYALMEQFTEAGVTVHLNLAKVSEAMGGKKTAGGKSRTLYRTDNQYQLCIHKTVVYETRNRYRRWSVWLSADFADHFVRGSCYLPEVPGSDLLCPGACR